MPQIAPTVELNNGQKMPLIGLGTWRSYESDGKIAVKDAIDIGYRHLDTAFAYQNEHEVGQAINDKIAEGVIKREDIFVVTKLAGIHHDPERVEHALRTSLKNLNLEYVDQYLIHFPVGQIYKTDDDLGTPTSNVDYVDTWRAMEKLVDFGFTRGIGLSNFNPKQTQRILNCARIKPVVNQVECHPCYNQKKFIEFCKNHNIAVTAYSPLAKPKPDQHWPPFMYDATALKLSEKIGKSPAQIALRYLIQIGTIPVPKSVSKNLMAENFDIFDFELTAEDMAIMDQYHKGSRTIPFSGLSDHKHFPFNSEF